MNFGQALRYPIQDPQWVSKVLLGTLISIVPILNFAAYGYALDALNNTYHGRETPLPEWNDLGRYMLRGFFGSFLIPLIWTLPLLVLVCPIIAILAASAANSPTGEPSGAAAALAGCFYVLVFLGSIALTPLVAAATARYATTDQLNEALPGPVWREVRGHMKPWLMILLYNLALGAVIGIVAVPLVLCTVGIGVLLVLPLGFYLLLVQYYWYAQAHRESTGGYVSTPAMV